MRKTFTTSIYLTLVLAIVLPMGISGYISYRQVKRSAFENMQATQIAKFHSINFRVTELQEQATNVARVVASSRQLTGYLQQRNRAAALTYTQELMRALGMEYLVVVDQQANIFLRAHQPDRFDDNIGTQVNIQSALRGENRYFTENGKIVRFSIRASAPIRDSSGAIIGAVSTGFVLGQAAFVEKIKQQYDIEASIFDGASILQSTVPQALADNLQLPEEVHKRVLQGDSLYTYFGKMGNIDYCNTFAPIHGPSGEVRGAVWLASPTQSTYTLLNRMSRLQLLLIVVSILLSVGALGWQMRRAVVRPTSLLLSTAKRIAEGDLKDALIPVQVKNEFGQILLAVQSIAARLRLTVEHLHEASQKMDEVCSTINHGSTTLQSAAGDMARRQQLISSELSGITQTIGENSRLSNAALGEFQKLSDAVTLGQQASRDAFHEVINMREQTDIIKRIAAQTNILALNAAVEAARAGQAGAGFAVVAHEVGVLAGKSAEAAEHITKKIEDNIQHTEHVQQALEALSPLGKRSEDLITQVNDSSADQANRMTSIDEAAQGLATMVQRNVREADLLATTAGTLEAIAQEFQSVIQLFHL